MSKIEQSIKNETARYGAAMVRGDVAEMVRCAERLDRMNAVRANGQASRHITGGIMVPR